MIDARHKRTPPASLVFRRCGALGCLVLYVFCALNLPLIELAHGLSHLFDQHEHHHHHSPAEVALAHGSFHHAPGAEASHSHPLLDLLHLDADKPAWEKVNTPSEKKDVKQPDKHPKPPLPVASLTAIGSAAKPLFTPVVLVPLHYLTVVSPPPEFRL